MLPKEMVDEVVAVISLVDREEGGSDMLRRKYNYRSIFTARADGGGPAIRPIRRRRSPQLSYGGRLCALTPTACMPHRNLHLLYYCNTAMFLPH